MGGGGSTTVTQPITSPAQEQAITTLMPYELAIARGGTEEALNVFDPTVSATQGALQLSPEERALPGEIASVNLPLADTLSQGAGELRSQARGLEGPVPADVLQPLQEEFAGTVLPSISSAAIRAGAPGGSAEQGLTRQAITDYGRGAASALDTQAVQRLNALNQALGTEAGIGSTIGQQLLAGPMAAGQLAQQGRQLDVQSAQTPWNMAQQLMGLARGIQVPWAGQGSTSTTTQNPPIGQEVMGGIGAAASLAMMLSMMGAFSSRKLKKGIQPLDRDEYADAIAKLRETPIVRYNYRWERDGSRKHIGPILEMSPEEIRGSDLHINLLDYAGLQHAGLKNLDKRLQALEL